MNVAYEAPPTLRRFMRSSDFVRCAVGPVGGGKSSACVMEILARACGQAPGPDGVRRTRFAVIRNTYSQLRDTTRKTFEQWFNAGDYGKWHEQSFTYTLKFPKRKSDGTSLECEVLFRALDRPEDVKKLLSLELTGAYINEAREIPKSVLEVLETRVGRYPSKVQGGCTWFGIWMDTNPWHGGHWASRLLGRVPGYSVFRQPSGLSDEAENTENLPSGYYQRLCAGKDQAWVDVYVRGLDATHDEGSVYGRLLDDVTVEPFGHEPDGIYTTFDLGYSDSTAIWFWRLSASGVDFVDHYESHGQPMSHYFDVVRNRGYQYMRHYLPHDARARTLATGVSIMDLATDEWPGKVAIAPGLSIEDGIAAARWLLEQKPRFHGRAAEGLEALRAYKYEWDEEARTFSRRPMHDWSSHTADAFRYAATVVKVTKLIDTREPPPKPRPVRAAHEFTLDELWEDN